MIRKCLALFVTFVVCQGAGPYFYDGPPIRSDLPLMFEKQWPVPLELGSAGIFYGGDWQSRPTVSPADGGGFVSWMRWAFSIHPNYYFTVASERQDLARRSSDIGIVGELGRPPGQSLDLYAIQFGARGGSDYVIVSAPSGSPVKQLTVLDVRCMDDNGDAIVLPDVELRRTDDGVLHPTDYCVVKSVAGLRALAIAALARNPAAIMEWIGEVPANER